MQPIAPRVPSAVSHAVPGAGPTLETPPHPLQRRVLRPLGGDTKSLGQYTVQVKRKAQSDESLTNVLAGFSLINAADSNLRSICRIALDRAVAELDDEQLLVTGQCLAHALGDKAIADGDCDAVIEVVMALLARLPECESRLMFVLGAFLSRVAGSAGAMRESDYRVLLAHLLDERLVPRLEGQCAPTAAALRPLQRALWRLEQAGCGAHMSPNGLALLVHQVLARDPRQAAVSLQVLGEALDTAAQAPAAREAIAQVVWQHLKDVPALDARAIGAALAQSFEWRAPGAMTTLMESAAGAALPPSCLGRLLWGLLSPREPAVAGDDAQARKEGADGKAGTADVTVLMPALTKALKPGPGPAPAVSVADRAAQVMQLLLDAADGLTLPALGLCVGALGLTLGQDGAWNPQRSPARADRPLGIPEQLRVWAGPFKKSQRVAMAWGLEQALAQLARGDPKFKAAATLLHDEIRWTRPASLRQALTLGRALAQDASTSLEGEGLSPADQAALAAMVFPASEDPPAGVT